MNQIKTQAPSLLKNLVEESQADGAILIFSVGGQVFHAHVGKMDFPQTLTAFAQACAETST